MNDENKKDYLIAIYGIFYFTLTEMKLLGEYAEPLKIRKKDKDEKKEDSIAIYKWLAEKMRGISENQIKERIQTYNGMIKKLHDDFFLNQYLMGLYMLDHYLHNEGSDLDRNLILPKVKRLIKTMRINIIRVNSEKNGNEIIIDSSHAASNIWRMFNGKAQLTREIREARIAQWKEEKRKKYKQ